MASKIKVNMSIDNTSEPILLKFSYCTTSRNITRSRTPKSPASTAKKEAKVMRPNPPIWIRMSKTICPKREKWCPVSTTMSPVTQVAEVAVKRAFSTEVFPPGAVDRGKRRNKVPIAMIVKKVATTVKGGERREKEDSLIKRGVLRTINATIKS